MPDIDIFAAPFTPAESVRPTTELDILRRILAMLSGTGSAVPGFAIPAYDYAAMTYYGSTNNVETITYKTGGSGGTTVATLTFTYVGSGASNDANISSITRT